MLRQLRLRLRSLETANVRNHLSAEPLPVRAVRPRVGPVPVLTPPDRQARLELAEGRLVPAAGKQRRGRSGVSRTSQEQRTDERRTSPARVQVDEESVRIRVGRERDVADGAEALWRRERRLDRGRRRLGLLLRRYLLDRGRRGRRVEGGLLGLRLGRLGRRGRVAPGVGRLREVAARELVGRLGRVVDKVGRERLDDRRRLGRLLRVEDDVLPAARRPSGRRKSAAGQA